MEKKKFKWPKFLTIKRMIFLGILVIVAVILLTYFLGGYKEAKASTDLMPFSKEGFVSYDTYLAEKLTEVKAHNEQFAEDINSINSSNYITETPKYIDQIWTTENKTNLNDYLSRLRASFGMSTEEYNSYYDMFIVKPCTQPADYTADDITYNEQFLADIADIDNTNYQTRLPEAIDAIRTVDNRNAVEAKLDEVKNSISMDPAVYASLRSRITSIPDMSNEGYAKKLLDKFELLYSNDSFAFYFNYRYTSFRLDQIEGSVDNIINSWYSTPQSLDDPNAKGGKNTIYQQQSPIILKFLNRSGAVKQYTAFEYAINDDIGTEKEHEYVTPSFEVKSDIENKSIQVYYDFHLKGIYYYYFPQNLRETRIKELIQISKANIDKKIEELTELKDHNDIQALRKYINEHMNNQIITNYFFLEKANVGLETCLLMEEITNPDEHHSVTPTMDNYVELIDAHHNDIEMLYKIACMMVHVEYEADCDLRNAKTGFRLFSRETIYLQNAYDKVVQVDPETDEDGNEIEMNYRQISSYAAMKKGFRDCLYQVFYTKFGYTEEDLENDQSEFNVTIDSTNAEFKVAVEYKLTDKGIQCAIINNSIYESNPTYYPLFQIDILPYFTSVINQINVEENKYQTNGYMVIPDGSGAVISLNNGKTDYTQYSKRVYTTDLAYGYKVKPTETQDIMLPMFGLTSNRIKDIGDNQIRNAYQAVVRATTGASQTSINAQVSLFNDSYNKVYISTTYRESQLVTIGTGYYAKDITKFTPEYVRVDTVLNYYFMSSKTKDFNYSDVAKFYQQVLIEDGVLSKEDADKTDDTVFNAELLGIYDYTTNFLGIVYDGHDTLTTLDQATKIMDELKHWGANDINLIYRGWRKSGFVNDSFNNMKFGSKLGNKSSYNNFVKYVKDNNISLYPLTSFLEINKYKEAYGKSRYSTRDVSSEYTVKYPYDLASNVYNKKLDPIYTLSPRFFDTFADKLSKNFIKSNPELNGMAFPKFGSTIVGDYKKYHILYRFNSVIEQLHAFDTMTKNGITNMSLNSPYEYAVKYADNITNLTYDSTLYEVFDYSIPLYQLVFSGYKDYSGLVINQNDEKGITYHLMNIFKTGSNVHFIFSYDSSSKLIQTNYNYYYYTEYKQWKNEVTQVLSEVAKYQLHKYVLDYYEQYNNTSNIYVSTYKEKQAALNGTNTLDTFKVYLNFSDKPFDIVNRLGETITVPKWNYYVDKEV